MLQNMRSEPFVQLASTVVQPEILYDEDQEVESTCNVSTTPEAEPATMLDHASDEPSLQDPEP